MLFRFLIKNSKILADFFTFSRLILIIPIFLSIFNDRDILLWLLICLASISDFLDGFFARMNININQKMKTFGARLDPLADKIFTISLFLWLVKVGTIPIWSFILLIIRELIITYIRNNNKSGLPAIKIAKFKSILFYISIIVFFIPDNNLISNKLTIEIGLLFYFMGIIVSYISALSYIKKV